MQRSSATASIAGLANAVVTATAVTPEERSRRHIDDRYHGVIQELTGLDECRTEHVTGSASPVRAAYNPKLQETVRVCH